MEAEILTDTLLTRADRTPDVVAFESIEPTGELTTLSYAQLASRASALAERIAAAEEGPVLLAYPSGLDYLIAVFGGFLAGRPVIPAFPPGPSSTPDRARLAGIVADAKPRVVLAPRRFPELEAPDVLSVPGSEADSTEPTARQRLAGSQIAIIQYTSGSTGRPRGVLVRHDSLAVNTAAIIERFEVRPDSRGLTWLPPFHDMGLIGGLLTPLVAGIPMRIMQPGDFLKSPLWWLRQISETGATHTGGPNFGYELCLHRARGDDALAGLDLSRWQVAFSGAETVRHRTMAAFAHRFAPTGFRPQAFLPCYGLAEATLIVSSGHWAGPDGDPDAPVSCGTPVWGQQVVIVDPERRTPVPDGTEGEIWVAGPHITPGYLSGDSAELFGELAATEPAATEPAATEPDGAAPDGAAPAGAESRSAPADTRFLRTGDLGYLRGGELFVSGRAKDVIVYRGVNHHAVDVEAVALAAVGRVGRTAAAFLVDTEPEPLPVLLLEVHGERDDALASTLRSAVLSRTGLRLALVALLPPRSLPRTSSGKIRRSAARDALLAGAYDAAVTNDPARLAALAEGRTTSAVSTELTGLICGIVAAVCEAGDCRPTDNLLDLGIDSVRAAEAAAVLENALGLTVSLETLLAAPTPAGAAQALLTDWLAAGREPAVVRERLAAAGSSAGTA